jgi:uncharacterized DUF497 family protein
MTVLKGILGFDWDRGNQEKNEQKHGVASVECEEVFFNEPLIIKDAPLSQVETQYFALGKTHGKRLLSLAFAIRRNRVRVISARPMSRKERKIYEKEDT